MKKIFKYKLLFAAALVGVFASCSDDEDVTLDTRSDKPVVTIDASSFTVTEGESFTVNLTSDKAISTGMDFKIELVGDEGTFRDYIVEGAEETTVETGAGIIGHWFTIPAYTTTYSVTITPIVDLEVEGTETFELALTSAVNGRGLVADDSGMITVTVNDYVSNDVGVRLVWDQNTTDWFGTIHESTYTYINASGVATEAPFTDYDFDIYVLDAVSLEEVTGYGGATGDSPEMTVIDADLPDGEYWIVVDLFDSGNAPAVEFEHVMSLQISKFGNWTVTVPVEGYVSNYPTSAPSGLAGGEMVVAVLHKTGTTYVLENEAGDVLAQGRMASLAGKVKSKVRK
ncbi:MAG: hypothetical protein ITG00_04460 [Flavobacterium sp.]|nr:hypothetical protein [Flavobacterium sp.]